jgi:hypothetical protein
MPIRFGEYAQIVNAAAPHRRRSERMKFDLVLWRIYIYVIAPSGTHSRICAR